MKNKLTENISTKPNDLAAIRDQIHIIESLFYNKKSPRERIDYLKLNANSELYDKTYEQRVRNPELNYLYVMDEVLSQSNINTSSALDYVNCLEEYISSPEYYRQLIFEGCNLEARSYIDDLVNILKKNSVFLKDHISETAYAECIEDLEYLNPPKKKDELLEALNHLVNTADSIFQNQKGEKS